MYYVYLLQSKEGNKNYLGYTNDLRRRLKEHNSKASKYTSNYKDWELVYYEAFRNKLDARKRETKLKHNRNAKNWLLKRVAKSLE